MLVNIRAMRSEDWDVVAAIYKAGMDTNLATFETVCPSYAQWDAAHLARCRLVAEQEGCILGWAVLAPVSKRAVYAGVAEVSLYIAADARGQGIGTALLQELIKMAEAEGFWTLQSGIFADNEASIRLHARCGFRTVGTRERIGRDRNGAWRDTVLMERRSTFVGC